MNIIFSWSKYVACNYLPHFHIAFTGKSVPNYVDCIKVVGVRTGYNATSENNFMMEMTEPIKRDMCVVLSGYNFRFHLQKKLIVIGDFFL
jgi:hypothetical protein